MDRLSPAMPRPAMLRRGLGLALRHWRAIAWTYLCQLFFVLLLTARFYSQTSALLSTSLASARLYTAFDLGVLSEAIGKLSQFPSPWSGMWALNSLPFAMIYFVLTPGVLACYQTGEPCRLRSMLFHGLSFVVRILRIAVAAAVVAGTMLIAVMILREELLAGLDEHGVLGAPHALLSVLTALGVLLLASLLRLYFDLVEVCAVERGLHEDIPAKGIFVSALHLLRAHLLRAWISFFLLSLIGLACLAGSVYMAVQRLASPHWLGLFAVLQAGILLNLFTRFWQRAMETILVEGQALIPVLSVHVAPKDEVLDVIPNPEPAAPSLPEPDAGIFEG